MASVSMELMYEVLNAVQARQNQMDGKLDELKYEFQGLRTSNIAIRHEITGIHCEIAAIHATLIRHEHRLDRIERRLDIADAPSLT